MAEITGVQQHIAITICADSHEAEAKGYLYRRPEYLPLKLDKAVVVRKGLVSGKSTVDLIMEDEKGQKYVIMVTQALLHMIPE